MKKNSCRHFLPAVWGGLLCMLLLSGCASSSFLRGQPAGFSSGAGTEAETEVPADFPAEEVLFCVHVCGCVKAPGIYYLAADSRRMDAVNAAGGMTEEADPESLNLAEKICDGEQIRIPSREEGKAAREKELLLETNKVNLNTAGPEELMSLTGIGEVRAAEIIRSRETEGPFQKIEDIMRISGIGELAFEKIRERIKV